MPGLPDIEIPPGVIFLVFLSLLSFAPFSSLLDLRAYLKPILLLAIGLVLRTTAATATR